MMKNINNTEIKHTVEDDKECVGIHELIDFQIIQYRQAVDAHRIDLSKAEGRCVAWQDAEQDFSRNDRSSLSEKSRVEYCGEVCPHKKNCLIAMHFFQRKKAEPLHRVG